MNAPKSPESSGSKQPRRNSRSQFLVIVFLTAIPLLIAWGLFQTSFVREYFGHTNKGQLITPP
ncbi:MAG: hypothetical protein L0H29_04040, partial [Sinobacteraceae bacterium]|nr:hypothetical protein [Nevskiaceae bacterium]